MDKSKEEPVIYENEDVDFDDLEYGSNSEDDESLLNCSKDYTLCFHCFLINDFFDLEDQ